MQRGNVSGRENLDLIYEGGSTCAVKRNPYLVEFEAQRSNGGGQRRAGQRRTGQTLDGWEMRRTPQAGREMYRNGYAGPGRQGEAGGRTGARAGRGGERRYITERNADGRNADGRNAEWHGEEACPGERQRRNRNGKDACAREGINGGGRSSGALRTDLAPIRRPSRSRTFRSRRLAAVQRALIGLWVFCILVLAATLVIRNGRVSAGQENDVRPEEKRETESAPQYSGYEVQGLPAEEFAKHPAWTEDFLTVNEYSRPGDPLESVKNIFVHYTANQGTSAAQNRSYFEWLKDTHETSASAHFIIGCEGEIIQCVPLDEIAYAVQSRNGDSVSIECCYEEADGSFTQETYDSLISLLRWLVDVYDLDTEDILRHYDCGGKKCPLYYTENPDEWEELKKDVDKL